jgi:hypothetical protein
MSRPDFRFPQIATGDLDIGTLEVCPDAPRQTEIHGFIGYIKEVIYLPTYFFV